MEAATRGEDYKRVAVTESSRAIVAIEMGTLAAELTIPLCLGAGPAAPACIALSVGYTFGSAYLGGVLGRRFAAETYDKVTAQPVIMKPRGR